MERNYFENANKQFIPIEKRMEGGGGGPWVGRSTLALEANV